MKQKYVIERLVDGAVIERRDLGYVAKGDAILAARERCAKIPARQAPATLIRVGYIQSALAAEQFVPVAAFRKHPRSGRVTRI